MDHPMKEKLRLEGRGKTPVYLQAYRKLREMIVSGEFKKGEKLISEGELADLMEIGRTSLRTALVLLYEDGYVVTEHGRGTYITYEPGSASRYPDGYISIKERLELEGKPAHFRLVANKLSGKDPFLSEKLQANGRAIRLIEVLYYLGDDPVVISRGFVLTDYADSLEALHTLLDEKLTSSTSTFTSTSIEDSEDDTKELFPAKNVLLVSSTCYGPDGEPLAYFKDYYDNDVYKYRIRQNRGV